MLLVSIALANAPAGASLRLAATTGLTASTGYDINAAFSRISFTASKVDANLALAALKLNTGGATGTLQISVSATINDDGYLYLPTVGHFYLCAFALSCIHQETRTFHLVPPPVYARCTLSVAPSLAAATRHPVHHSALAPQACNVAGGSLRRRQCIRHPAEPCGEPDVQRAARLSGHHHVPR